jgi:GlpG protein
MRRIGTLDTEQAARRFADYLFSLDIKTRVDQSGSQWDVWGLEEDRIDDARVELNAFRSSPEDAKYATAAREAQQKRDAELRQTIEARKRQVNLRDHWNKPLWLQVPVTIGLIAATIALTLMSGFGRTDDVTAQLQIQHTIPAGDGMIRISPRPFNEVREGQIWRLATPMFLHYSPWHLFGNMYWLAVFGSMLERRQGSLSFLIKVLAIGVVSNIVQYVATDFGYNFGGMSGVVFGLFGYVWIKGQFDPDDGIGIARESAILFMVWMVLCSLGLVGNIANYAHSAGLVMGILLAAPTLIRRWLQ